MTETTHVRERIIGGSGIGSTRVPELDGLRGLAILLVVAAHYFFFSVTPAPGSVLAYVKAAGRLSWSGVDLFFVLSGFLIGGILLDARTSPTFFRTFYARRFFRIIPLYALVLAVFWGMRAISARLPGLSAVVPLLEGPVPWYVYATLLQNFYSAWFGTLGATFLNVTWSLAVEEQFYLALPALLRRLSGRFLLAALLVLAALAPCVRLLLLHYTPNGAFASIVLMPCRADTLLLGVLGALLVRTEGGVKWLGKLRPFLPGLLLLLFCGMGLLTSFWYFPQSIVLVSVGYTWIALFYLGLLLHVVTDSSGMITSVFRLRGLRYLGTTAYGIYLFHVPVRELVFAATTGGPPNLQSGLSVLLTVASFLCTLAVSGAAWRFLERPLISLGHRFSYSEPNRAK
jgi:peptidoglycan/LPS O-acetylase OafA/YrhL